MSKEQELYDKFVEVLNKRLDEDPTPKDLDVIMKFLQNQNIQAAPTKHTGLQELTTKLPFEDEDVLPLRVVK